jgi:hypothetical protein
MYFLILKTELKLIKIRVPINVLRYRRGQVNIKPSICTPLMIEMKQAKWKAQWIATFMLSGETKADAEHAYQVLYGNQSIDIYKDPVDDAKGICGTLRE